MFSSQSSHTISNKAVINRAIAFRPPILVEGKQWYIEFYAFDPALGNLRRKRIKFNKPKSKRERRALARNVILRLNSELINGWNPWLANGENSVALFDETCDNYEAWLTKMLNSGTYRMETYLSKRSYMSNLRKYVESRKVRLIYLYQLDRRFIGEFLNEIFLTRNNSAQTHNNYLSWLVTFCNWCVERGLLTVNPTDGIRPIDKRLIKKNRTVIPLDVVQSIGEWCKDHDPHFGLACQLLYYCFIRPLEMTRLLVGDINVQTCTVTLRGEVSKNRQEQVVTMPRHVLHMMIDLGVLSAPLTDHVFGVGMRPGPLPIDTKIFRDHWAKVRRALGLKKEWQFYSLKDTGITEMLDKNVASIAVRDQARHSSLAITEIYTRHDRSANPAMIDYEGSL